MITIFVGLNHYHLIPQTPIMLHLKITLGSKVTVYVFIPLLMNSSFFYFIASFLILCFFHVTGISEEEKKCLLHCVVIGGGPTGVEFSGELSDFIMRDVHERYTHVKDYIHVTLIEVPRTWLNSLPYRKAYCVS